jgi:hypothetical protein
VIAQCPLHRAGAALEEAPIATMRRMRLRPCVVRGVERQQRRARSAGPGDRRAQRHGARRPVDVVNGDFEVLYRRQNADWLRVVPLDEDDEDNIERCAGYEITVEPIA